LKNNRDPGLGLPECPHNRVSQDGGDLVCQDCGLILEERLVSKESKSFGEFYTDSQRDYERKIRVSNSKALQDPIVKEKYERIKTLEKWFRDYKSDFSAQKKTIDLLKSHGIGLNIDSVKYQEIRDRYLKYNKYHRRSYQNMVIIFLAIIWLEIKDTTNVRIEQFIKVSQDLGHKINKKMLGSAMEKVIRTEKIYIPKRKLINLEKEIKDKIKIVFRKDLNSIPYEVVKEFLSDNSEFEKMKIEMQLLANGILKQIPYEYIQNVNYKAFTAGLIYFVGQTLRDRKIFTQSIIETYSKFSSTTIRKKYNKLKGILGKPQEFSLASLK